MGNDLRFNFFIVVTITTFKADLHVKINVVISWSEIEPNER